MKIQALVIAFATLGLAAHADAAQLKPAQQVKANTIIKKVIPAYYGGKLQNFGIVTAIGEAALLDDEDHGRRKSERSVQQQPTVGRRRQLSLLGRREPQDIGLLKQLKQPVETRVTN